MEKINPNNYYSIDFQIINEINKSIFEIKEQLKNQSSLPQIRAEWASKSEVMKFLGLKETRFNELAKEYKLSSTSFGKKRFYKIKSIVQIFERNNLKL